MAPIMGSSGRPPKYTDPDNFTIEVHHGGNFKKGKYLGGRVEFAGLNVADKGTSFNVVVDTLDGDGDDEFEDNDEDLNENYEYVDEDKKANEEVNVDDRDFDKYVVDEGTESLHKELGEASSGEYHCNSEDLRSLSEKEEHDEVEGQRLWAAVWAAVRATTIPTFDVEMDRMLSESHEAYKWLKNRPASNWNRSHFSCNAKCDILLNNLCECFNAAILEVRDKPIVSLLEIIRIYLIIQLTVVNALPIMRVMRPLDFVHALYKRFAYERAYEGYISPMPSSYHWRKTGHRPIKPSFYHKQLGRPMISRQKEADEIPRGATKLRRYSIVITCTKCGVQGHNAVSCTTQGQASTRGRRGGTSRPRIARGVAPTSEGLNGSGQQQQPQTSIQPRSQSHPKFGASQIQCFIILGGFDGFDLI
ncbi:hypothetical protein PRUPE_7G015700 [Prunus persica]|uniref:CCHC-type domain-containing protein n=1 Tax=Prunus persica TaxID=3760 RepID=M5VTB3_PRUPE|nr:hypothetical protein PRUPE_7G015700 [Prunus persica]